MPEDQLAKIRELLARSCSEGSGTRVTNCIVHMHRNLTDRPSECHLCAADVSNHLRLAIAINEWLNRWKDDASAVLSEVKA